MKLEVLLQYTGFLSTGLGISAYLLVCNVCTVTYLTVGHVDVGRTVEALLDNQLRVGDYSHYPDVFITAEQNICYQK